MNVVFLTQSSSLDMFYRLMLSLQKSKKLDNIGFYIANQTFYAKFVETYPELESDKYTILKEWEIVSDASKKNPDMDKIKRYEVALGNPNLWGAVVCDRRLFLGEKCSYRQDYKKRFNHNQMLSILQEGISSVENFFDKVKPDIIFSFLCVTFGEYISYLISKSRGIPFLNLRPTRIENYVIFGESIFEPSEYLLREFNNYQNNNGKGDKINEARKYINFIKNQHAMYEGVIPPSRTVPKIQRRNKSIVSTVKTKLEGFYNCFSGKYKDDLQYTGTFKPLFFRRVLNPVNARRVNNLLSNHYVGKDDLKKIEYAFYPLHKEPEVTLLVYSKPYLNQIEVVRNFANSLPVGMKLVVKEHPAAIGWRSLGFYRKLLDIPNVCIAEPSLVSKDVIEESKLVAIISGGIGFEALLLHKPVISLGNCPFNILPDTMIRKVKALENLGIEINDLMRNYEYDENSMVNYIAATMESSAPVNLYSKLLGKKGVYSLYTGREGDDKDIQILTDYAIKRINESL